MVLNAHTDPMTEEQRKELNRLCDASGRQHMIEELRRKAAEQHQGLTHRS
jgi:hypothetical protein